MAQTDTQLELSYQNYYGLWEWNFEGKKFKVTIVSEGQALVCVQGQAAHLQEEAAEGGAGQGHQEAGEGQQVWEQEHHW